MTRMTVPPAEKATKNCHSLLTDNLPIHSGFFCNKEQGIRRSTYVHCTQCLPFIYQIPRSQQRLHLHMHLDWIYLYLVVSLQGQPNAKHHPPTSVQISYYHRARRWLHPRIWAELHLGFVLVPTLHVTDRVRLRRHRASKFDSVLRPLLQFATAMTTQSQNTINNSPRSR